LLNKFDRDHEASEQAEMSASRTKLLLQETVEAEETDEEKWTRLKGRSIRKISNADIVNNLTFTDFTHESKAPCASSWMKWTFASVAKRVLVLN